MKFRVNQLITMRSSYRIVILEIQKIMTNDRTNEHYYIVKPRGVIKGDKPNNLKYSVPAKELDPISELTTRLEFALASPV